MIKKALFVIALACLLAILLALPVGAAYDSVNGQLLLSPGSTEPWAYGATIEAYTNCDGPPFVWLPAGGQVVPPGTSTFNFPVAPPLSSTQACLFVRFNAGPVGTPVNQQVLFTNDPGASGAYGPLTIYSHTGPAAVTLQQVSASASTGSPALLAFGVLLLGALSLAAARRSRV